MAPNSSINVTHISKQYFVLGQLDGSLQAGDQEGEWEGELSSSSGSCRFFAHFGSALLHGHLPEGWLQMFYQLGHLIWQP